VTDTLSTLDRSALVAALGLLLTGVACSASDDSGASSGADSSKNQSGAAATYKTADSTVALAGSLLVRVTVDQGEPPDTTVFPIRDFEACGSQLTDNSIMRDGAMLAGAIVWLSDVSAGKDVPVRKRYELTHQRCLLWPRTQAVSVGGTLNIRNSDSALHVLRFSDAQTGDELARINQSERGQVVPIEFLLQSPRLIEVVCESHPWTKAWIRVFDHPYYAVTDRTGAATLDSVPAGVHRLVVWHERFGEHRDSVIIGGGGRVETSVLFRR
jgi:hypothetical protein